MKRIFFNPLSYVVIAASLLIISCNKSDDAEPSGSSFTWIYQGVTVKAKFDSAFINSQPFPYFIVAGMGINVLGSGSGVRVALSSFNKASYTLGPGNSFLEYRDLSGNTFTASSGTFTISDNSNNTLSGNYSATVTDAGGTVSNPISGNFSGVPVSP